MNSEDFRILSVRQPFAWLIVNGIKDIENRSRYTPFRGCVFIHASVTKPSKRLLWEIEDEFGHRLPETFTHGAVIGHANIDNCLTESISPWFFGPVGWQLSKARTMTPVPTRGRLGLCRLNATEERLLLPPWLLPTR